MDPLAVGGRRRRVSKQSLEDIAQDVIRAFGDEFARRGVAVEIVGALRTEVKTNREVVQQVLANLLDNSLYWSQQTTDSTPIIRIEKFVEKIHVF